MESANRKLRGQAVHDALTGLLNKRGFDDAYERMLSAAVRYGRKFGLALIDLDYFKQVNDRYGHAAGNFVLREVAKIIEGVLRQTDIVARWGGDEFAALLDENSLEQAAVPLERIRARIEAHTFQYEGAPIELTVSVGYAAYEPDKFLPVRNQSGHQLLSEMLFKKADLALYFAKQAGRNRASSQI